MPKNRENLRLRLVTDKDKKFKNREEKCFLLNVAQVFVVLLFLMVLTFIALRVVRIENDITEKEENYKEDTIPGSDFCKSVNAENMSLVALGYLTGVRGDGNTMEAKNQVYYITDRLFTDQEACAIEAALRLLQDKSVFIIEIGNIIETHTEVDYVRFLRNHYTNLNLIKSSPDMFFKGSPFQNHFNNVSDFAIFAAKVLLVWQFGGTVLSPNFMLLARRLFDSNEGFCEVDRELLFCPNQCSAFVYQLVKTILDLMKSPKKWHAMTEQFLEQIVNESVAAYCGDQAAVAVGCIGINRIKPHSVCNDIHKDCEYLRVQQWKERDKNWKTVVQRFCPKIVSKYMPNLT